MLWGRKDVACVQGGRNRIFGVLPVGSGRVSHLLLCVVMLVPRCGKLGRPGNTEANKRKGLKWKRKTKQLALSIDGPKMQIEEGILELVSNASFGHI